MKRERNGNNHKILAFKNKRQRKKSFERLSTYKHTNKFTAVAQATMYAYTHSLIHDLSIKRDEAQPVNWKQNTSIMYRTIFPTQENFFLQYLF